MKTIPWSRWFIDLEIQKYIETYFGSYFPKGSLGGKAFFSDQNGNYTIRILYESQSLDLTLLNDFKTILVHFREGESMKIFDKSRMSPNLPRKAFREIRKYYAKKHKSFKGLMTDLGFELDRNELGNDWWLSSQYPDMIIKSQSRGPAMVFWLGYLEDGPKKVQIQLDRYQKGIHDMLRNKYEQLLQQHSQVGRTSQ